MHSAPPVLVSVGRFVVGERVLLGLALFTLLALGVWLGQSQAHPAQALMAVLVWAVTAGLSAVFWRWQSAGPGQLRWDGQAWWFQDSTAAPLEQAVTVQVVGDFGALMGLRLRLGAQASRWAGRARYVWLHQRQAPQAWHALRCAAHQDHTL